MRLVAWLVEDSNDLDRILSGPVSDELVAMKESSYSQNLLGVILAAMNDAASTAELPPHEGRTGKLQGGGLCQGPCLPLTDALPWLHLCVISHVKNAGILSTPAKIKR